ncbi:hypothetical protein GN316_00670 [Xylophilus sp. Kf1]|nr:hypothetical protein [Xylophilus sp. Kf1]
MPMLPSSSPPDRPGRSPFTRSPLPARLPAADPAATPPPRISPPAPMPDLSLYIGEQVPATPPSRLRRLASHIGHFFRPPAAGGDRLTSEDAGTIHATHPAHTTHATAHRQTRPTDPAFQRFHELIDGIGNAPEGGRPAIASAITARLRRAGFEVPPARHTAGVAIRMLLSPHGLDMLGDQGLHMGDLLLALRRADEVEAAQRPELQRRLMGAFEATVNRLAQTHVGLRALRDSCDTPLRPLADTQARPSDPGPRIAAFSTSAARLLHRLPDANATPGQLATCLFHCLRQETNLSHEEVDALIGQVVPAVEALIHAEPAARKVAAALRVAAQRLENYLQIAACRDIADPDPTVAGAFGIDAMSPRRARGFLFNRLLLCALDPALLDARLDTGAVRDWMHPSALGRAQTQQTVDRAMAVLRTMLEPMLATGLIDERQQRALLRQAWAHLRASVVTTAP